MHIPQDATLTQLSPPQLRAVVAFAQSHDWGRGAYYEEGRVHGIVEVSYGPDNQVSEEEVSFATLRAMRDWAGY